MTGRPLSPEGLVLRAWSRAGPEKSGRSLAVGHSDPDLKLGALPVDTPGHQAQRQQRHAKHAGLDVPSAVVFTPSSPVRMASTASFRAMAPARVGFQRLAFLRGGITGWALRAAFASWHSRIANDVGNDAFYAIIAPSGQGVSIGR